MQGSTRDCRWVLLGTLVLSLCGCGTVADYVHNGFKVGPNYQRPPAPVAPHWIDHDDVRIRSKEADDSHWWTVFCDPLLDDLIQNAYRQNLTLREAGFRVLESRANLSFAVGELFPRKQHGNGDNGARHPSFAQKHYGPVDYGVNLAWELDFWGRFRRAVEAANDELDASVENYDDVLVTLLGDVAAAYVQARVVQQQIAYARQTLGLQRDGLDIARARVKGAKTSDVDVSQGQSDVSSTAALIEHLQIEFRESANRLCILLGLPPEDMVAKLGESPIPAAPLVAAVGVPADLLRRRPDVRRAERHAAAQNAQIGVAVAEWFPHISFLGTVAWSAETVAGLSQGDTYASSMGPSFTWNIVNYGRVLSNIRAQDAKFQALVVRYQNTILKAGEEVENGLHTFLHSQHETHFLTEAVVAETKALTDAIIQYKGGRVDYNRVVVIQEKLLERQQALARAQGQIALGLIQVYRALGGGWQIRCGAATTAPPIQLAPIEEEAPKVKLLPPVGR